MKFNIIIKIIINNRVVEFVISLLFYIINSFDPHNNSFEWVVSF